MAGGRAQGSGIEFDGVMVAIGSRALRAPTDLLSPIVSRLRAPGVAHFANHISLNSFASSLTLRCREEDVRVHFDFQIPPYR